MQLLMRSISMVVLASSIAAQASTGDGSKKPRRSIMSPDILARTAKLHASAQAGVPKSNPEQIQFRGGLVSSLSSPDSSMTLSSSRSPSPVSSSDGRTSSSPESSPTQGTLVQPEGFGEKLRRLSDKILHSSSGASSPQEKEARLSSGSVDDEGKPKRLSFNSFSLFKRKDENLNAELEQPAVHEVPSSVREGGLLNIVNFSDRVNHFSFTKRLPLATALHMVLEELKAQNPELEDDKLKNLFAQPFKGSKLSYMIAARGEVEDCRYLITKGIDITETPENEFSPIMHAIGDGRIDLVNVHLEAGAQLDEEIIVEGKSFTARKAAETTARATRDALRQLAANAASKMDAHKNDLISDVDYEDAMKEYKEKRDKILAGNKLEILDFINNLDPVFPQQAERPLIVNSPSLITDIDID